MASLALGLVGAAVGFAIGGPGLAVAVGFMVGSMAGTALFPTTTYGPKLTDLHIQGSSYGTPIPIEWGSARLGGNVIWKTDLIPHENKSGGKGGPQVVTTTYSASFDIVICESRGDHSLGRVWVNGQLKGDYRSGAAQQGDLPLVFYDGNDEQMPDPTEEGIIGSGLVPAYRGVARVVLTDLDLSPYGNTIPQFNFEMLTGEVQSCPLTSTFNAQTSIEWHSQFGSTLYPYIVSWDAGNPHTEPDVIDIPVVPAQGLGWLYFPGPMHLIGGSAQRVWVGLGNYQIGTDLAIGAGTISNISGDPVATYNLAAGNIPDGLYVHGAVGSYDQTILFVFTGELPHNGSVRITKWWKLVDAVTVSQGTVDPPLTYYNVSIGHFVAPHYEVEGSSQFENNGRFMWHHWAAGALPGGSGNYMLLYEIDDAGNFASICDGINLSHWAGGYTSAVATDASGSVAAFAEGYCGVVSYQTYEIFSRYDHSQQGVVLLSDIVADVCERDGLTSDQYDVTDIEIPVRGYVLTETPITGRAALESILPVYSVDATESDGVIKFVQRAGKTSVATIADDDLSAHADGQELPAKLEVVRAQDSELPMHMILKYLNAGTDYLLGAQQTRRMTGASKVQVTANVPVVLSDAEAKKAVDVWLFNAWIERETYLWSTTRKHAKYEPTDIVTVGGLDLRITSKTEGADGVIKWEGRKAYAELYTQAGDASDGAPGAPAEGQVPGTIVPPQLTDLVLLDIAYIVDPAAQNLYWAAMTGHDRPDWRGASLQRSVDGGTSYNELINTTTRSIIGVANDALGDFLGGNVFDEVNSVSVTIGNGGGELSSTTYNGVLNGVNEFLLGGEIVQARDAVLTSDRTYKLTGLLRGRRGTEWAMATHLVGEQFVVLPAHPLAYQTSDIGLTRQYKAVTIGSTLASAIAQNKALRGVSMTPYSPVHDGAGTNAAGDWILQWTRRARVNGSWLNFTDVPLDEPTEAYRVTLWTAVDYLTVAATIDCATPTTTITAAQQTTIFGSPQSVLYWSVAQIGRLGPGYDTLGRAPTLVTPPPATPTPPPPGAVYLGELHFDGSQTNSEGVSGTVVAYAQIAIPNPLPAGWNGQQTYVSIFESGSGTYAKRMWLSRAPFDYSGVYPAYGEGNGSANIYMIFNATSAYAVTVSPGEVWYLTIKNELPDGTPSCPPGGNGNFAVRMYPPSL